MARWQTGVANVERADSRSIFVRCPHCGDVHSHARNVLGSRQVVAGCHTGFTRCREYSIPDLGIATSRPRKFKAAA